jgi:hypothetical protein
MHEPGVIMPQARHQELSSTHMLTSGRNRAVKDLVIAALRCEPATRVDFIREASHWRRPHSATRL